jgi:hypothetical protein
VYLADAHYSTVTTDRYTYIHTYSHIFTEMR